MESALKPSNSNLPARLALVALLAEVAHLGWEYFHGGILTHHVLQRADLPGISNLWGLLILPALAWWAGGRIQRRLVAGARPATAIVGAAVALLMGLALSASFLGGLESVSAAVFLGMFVLAVLLPAYRAECWLALVLAMCFTFGPLIPLVIGGVLAGLSALVHLGLRPAVARGWSALRGG